MKTCIANTYHCIKCGRVVHAEEGVGPTQCCGQTMATAVVETTSEGTVATEKTGCQTDSPTTANKGYDKPR